MMKKITFILTLLLTGFLGNFSFAQHSFTTVAGPTVVASGSPVTLNINDAGNTLDTAPASSTGSYSTFSVSVDWTDGSGGPWSSEADLTMTTTAGSVLIDPATTGSANDAVATTLTFDGTFTAPYDPTTDGFLDIVLNQSFGGSSANWSNIVVTIYESPSCVDPDTFASSNVTTNTVDLSWNDPSGTQFDFEYVVQASGVGTPAGSGVAVGTNSATGISTEVDTTPLAPATDYEAWVRADCGGGDYSAWVGPIYFTTLCTTTIAPFLESFETAALPVCWTQGGDNAWEYGSLGGGTPAPNFADYGANGVTDHSVSGTGTFIGMDGSDNGDGEVSTLSTPMIDVSGLTTPYLSYYVFSNNVDDAAQNELLVEFYDGAAWNTVETIQANLGTDWVMYGVDLTAFTITGDVQARFTVTGAANGGFTYYNDILIDDVSIDEAPTCFAPTGLAVSNVTTNTVDITWNDGSGGAQFDFYYVIQPAGTGTAGITVENYYDYSSGVPFTATCTDITDCANTLLTPNTAYEVFVRDDCGGAWVGPINFTTACDAIATFPFTETFEDASVSRDCWSNIQEVGTADWTYQTGSSGGTVTTAYNGTLNARFVSASGTASPITKLVSPTLDLSSLTTPRLVFYYAQEDWSGDQNELKVYYRISSSDPWVEIGYYTASIAAWTEVILTLPNPSATYQIAFEGINNWGRANVVDDVTIEESPSCIEPDTFVSSNVTTNSVDLSWNDPSGTQFDFEYVVQASGVGMPAGSGVAISATSATGITAEVDTTPLAPNTAYEAWVRADCGGGDYSAWVGPIYFTTNIEVVCGTPVNTTYCYTDNDTTSWTFTSDTGDPLRVTFNAGEVENTWDELIVLDSDGVTELYNGYGASGDLTGLTFDSTGDTITVMISSDGSGNCGGSGYTSWDFDVACATCVNPTVNFTVVEDCGNSQFSIDVDVTDLGTATSLTITDGTTTLTNISATGVQSFGPYPVGTPISIDVNNEQDASCFVTSGSLVDACPAVNDDCANAIQVSCGGTYTGDTTLATDSGSNTSADVWYYYDGAAGDITASLCTNTAFDSYIRVFDACGGTELAGNDDACSTQSEVTFTADGTSTYYIMVEGFGANEGAFELNVSCVLSANSFDSNSFVAYPNPVKDVLTLEYSNEITNVSVYNMLGQEVLSRTIEATSTQIDMSSLNAGTYLVNVTSGDIQKTIKVVKQ